MEDIKRPALFESGKYVFHSDNTSTRRRHFTVMSTTRIFQTTVPIQCADAAGIAKLLRDCQRDPANGKEYTEPLRTTQDNAEPHWGMLDQQDYAGPCQTRQEQANI